MYQILCDGYILHDSAIDELKVVNPKCSLEINKTGALNFKVLPDHPYYDKIKKHTSQITLCQDGKVLFCGRVLNDESDFENIKVVECEGELSYFIDTIQRPKNYALNGADTIKRYVSDLVTIHNSQVDEVKQFVVGSVTVDTASFNSTSNYDTTQSLIDKLISTYGGMFRVRHSDGKKYLDYVKEFTTCNQTIQFGKNLVDLTKYLKGEDIYTAIIPVGAKIESESTTDTESEIEQRTTIVSLPNSLDGTIQKTSDYIYDVEAVKKWGWIWKKLDLSKVDDANELLRVAKETLKNSVNDTLSIDLTAVDLHLLDVDIDSIEVGDKIRCVSEPHELNTMLIVQSMTIDIDNPANNTIKLTSPDNPFDVDVTLTAKDKDTTDVVDRFKDSLDTIPSYDNINKTIDTNNEELIKYIDENHPSYDDFDNKVNDFKDWADERYVQENQLTDYPKKSDLAEYPKKSDLTDYAKTSDLSNYASKTDLSEYAKIVDVNAAFEQLATALEGV